VTFELDVPSHPHWVGLPLAGDVDVEAAAVVQGMIGHSASPDHLDATTAALAGVTRIARRHVDRVSAGRRSTVAAWMLLPAPLVLVAGPVAFLHAGPLAADARPDDALAAVVDLAADRHGELEVEDLDTASGTALSVHVRPVRVADGERLVDDSRVVLWPSPRDGLVLYLSLYVVDLVEGDRAAEPFLELARSVRWRLS
jgi:hypothetical protein